MMPTATTLIQLLKENNAHFPDKVGYRFLNADLTVKCELTYAELHNKALAIAALLQQKGLKPSDRVILAYEPGLDFIVGFFACLFAGIIAVPCYPPFNKKTTTKLISILNNCDAKMILTSDLIISQILKLKRYSFLSMLPFSKLIINKFTNKYTPMLDVKLYKYNWLSTDNIEPDFKNKYCEIMIEPEHVAFIQYTSGSTGDPKGILVTHSNLMENIILVSKTVKSSDNDVGVSWLPVYHDMGLIGGLLFPLYNKMQALLFSPFDFLKNPLIWLQAITKFRATISVGPNFAYAHCCEKISKEDMLTLDLSSWRTAMNGAEPISLKVLQNFEEKFSACGFNSTAFFPCYGLAESTLYVSGHFGILTDTNKKLVCCGTIDHEGLVIVDPDTRLQCEECKIGEICLKGPCVTLGIWNKSSHDDLVPHPSISLPNGNTYIRTGDLGFISNKKLFITGRIKNLIIIRGNNYYPHDIEESVYLASNYINRGNCVAFSSGNDEREQLVIVAEVKNSLPIDELKILIDKIKQSITLHNQLSADVILIVQAKSIYKTTSGKIQHYANKTAFLNNEFKPLLSYYRK